MSRMRGASRQPDSLTRFLISNGAPHAQQDSAVFWFMPWHHSHAMRSMGSAAEGAAATRGASVLTGVLSGTGLGAAFAGGAAGAFSALTSRPPSNPQKVSWSSKLRLHFGHCFILVSEKSLQPLTTRQASR